MDNSNPTSTTTGKKSLWTYIDISSNDPTPKGPVPKSYIIKLLRSGKISTETPVKSESMIKWGYAGCIFEEELKIGVNAPGGIDGTPRKQRGGGINRLVYGILFALLWLTGGILIALEPTIMDDEIFFWVVFLLLAILTALRLKNAGRSMWMCLLVFVPLANLVFFILLLTWKPVSISPSK